MTIWQELLQQGYDDIQGLQERFRIEAEELQQLCGIQDKFPMYVNPYYLSLIDANSRIQLFRKRPGSKPACTYGLSFHIKLCYNISTNSNMRKVRHESSITESDKEISQSQ